MSHDYEMYSGGGGKIVNYLWFSETRNVGGELDEVSQKVQIFSYK